MSAFTFAIMTVLLFSRMSTCLSTESEKGVCCHDLGCYSAGGDFFDPRRRPINSVPLCGLQSKLFLHLNTIRNPLTTQLLNPYAIDTISHSNFNPKEKSKIIIHGFLDTFTGLAWKRTTAELLKDGDHNVVRLDWSEGNLPPYLQAVANLRLVGAYVARFIQHIVTEHGVNSSDIHIIGHSLGAHGAGYAGATAQSKYNITIGRITGLDPAGPYFTDMPISVRLDPTDAQVVDTLVTNGDAFAFGSTQSMGHINFYPNGGMHQPGCKKEVYRDLITSLTQLKERAVSKMSLSMPLTKFDMMTTTLEDESVPESSNEASTESRDMYGCSHSRAVSLFYESIANSSCLTSMKSFQCTDYKTFLKGADECSTGKEQRSSPMGYHADLSLASKDQVKKFYIMTTSKSPFCPKLTIQLTLKKAAADSDHMTGSLYVTLFGNISTSEKILLTPEPIDFQPGSTLIFYPAVSKDLGKLLFAILFWEAKPSYKPLDWLKGHYILLEGNIYVTDQDGLVSVLEPARSKIQERQDVLATLVKSFYQ